MTIPATQRESLPEEERPDEEEDRKTQVELHATQFEEEPTQVDLPKISKPDTAADLKAVPEAVPTELTGVTETPTKELEEQATQKIEAVKTEIQAGEAQVKRYAEEKGEEIPAEEKGLFKKLRDRVGDLLRNFRKALKREEKIVLVEERTPEDLERKRFELEAEKVVREKQIQMLRDKIVTFQPEGPIETQAEELTRRNLGYELKAVQAHYRDILTSLRMLGVDVDEPAGPTLAEKETAAFERGRAKIGDTPLAEKPAGAETLAKVGKVDISGSPETVGESELLEEEGAIEPEALAEMIKSLETMVEKDIDTELEATRLEAEYAAQRNEEIEELIKTRDVQNLHQMAEQLQIMWVKMMEERAERAHSREERVNFKKALFKKALRGEGMLAEEPTTADLILRDLQQIKEALEQIKTGEVPKAEAEVEEEWFEADVPEGAPEEIPDLEQQKGALAVIEEKEYEIKVPAELLEVQTQAIKAIENRLRELDRLAGSYDARQAAGLTMRAVEDEAALLLDQRKELAKQNIPDDLIRTHAVSLEKQIAETREELVEKPKGVMETPAEELARRNKPYIIKALEARHKEVIDYLDRGYEVALEGEEAAPSAEAPAISIELTKKFDTDRIKFVDLSAEYEFLRRKKTPTDQEMTRMDKLMTEISDLHFWKRYRRQVPDHQARRIDAEVAKQAVEMEQRFAA